MEPTSAPWRSALVQETVQEKEKEKEKEMDGGKQKTRKNGPNNMTQKDVNDMPKEVETVKGQTRQRSVPRKGG